MNDQNFLSTSLRKIKDQNLTFFINPSVVNFYYGPTTAITYNNARINKDFENLNGEESVLENESPVLKSSSNVPAAIELTEDKKSLPAVTLANSILASGYVAVKKP